jgi:S-adenosylmethionine decarboxylase
MTTEIAASKHCVSELYKGDFDKLNDENYVYEVLVQAADKANATLLDVRTHKFNPQGVTGFALLAESHIAIHTWPELNYAAVDVFTCGNKTNPELACIFLATAFNAESQHIGFVERHVPYPEETLLVANN